MHTLQGNKVQPSHLCSYQCLQRLGDCRCWGSADSSAADPPSCRSAADDGSAAQCRTCRRSSNAGAAPQRQAMHFFECFQETTVQLQLQMSTSSWTFSQCVGSAGPATEAGRACPLLQASAWQQHMLEGPEYLQGTRGTWQQAAAPVLGQLDSGIACSSVLQGWQVAVSAWAPSQARVLQQPQGTAAAGTSHLHA